MHAFEIPRKYRTIYICDSFNLAGSRDNGLETLRRCYAHLHDGGALILNIDAEYAWPQEWERWRLTKSGSLPEPWPEEGKRRVAPDGSEYIERFRLVSVNLLEQSYVRQVRLEKWVAGQRVASEESTVCGDMYLKNEVLLMLKFAGFRQVTVRGDYTDELATPESKELIFTAIK